MKLQVEIITPEKIAYQKEADEIIVPTTTGQIAILPNHVALVAQVAQGELVIKENNKDFYFGITGGFLEVSNNKVSILADYAVESDSINETKAKEAKERAEKLMKEKLSQHDMAQLDIQLRRSILELKVAGRKRKVL